MAMKNVFERIMEIKSLQLNKGEIIQVERAERGKEARKTRSGRPAVKWGTCSRHRRPRDEAKVGGPGRREKKLWLQSRVRAEAP